MRNIIGLCLLSVFGSVFRVIRGIYGAIDSGAAGAALPMISGLPVESEHSAPQIFQMVEFFIDWRDPAVPDVAFFNAPGRDSDRWTDDRDGFCLFCACCVCCDRFLVHSFFPAGTKPGAVAALAIWHNITRPYLERRGLRPHRTLRPES